MKFISSWPNRCPLWIVTFLLSFTDFWFALSLRANYRAGAKFNPYVVKLYDDVRPIEWTYLLVITCLTFLVSMAWALAEIFRESRANVESVKSDVETYVEGITVHVLTVMWLILVCIVTMPGGSASLRTSFPSSLRLKLASSGRSHVFSLPLVVGNLYFTTWATLFSVVSTLFWYLRDCRKNIAAIIREEEEEYEMVKKTILRREEKRLARLAREQEEKGSPERDASNTDMEESRLDDDNGVLCEDVPVDDDLTISIASNYKKSEAGASSLASPPDRSRAPDDATDKTPPAGAMSASSQSYFMSALSYIFPVNVQEDDKLKGDENG